MELGTLELIFEILSLKFLANFFFNFKFALRPLALTILIFKERFTPVLGIGVTL